MGTNHNNQPNPPNVTGTIASVKPILSPLQSNPMGDMFTVGGNTLATISGIAGGQDPPTAFNITFPPGQVQNGECMFAYEWAAHGGIPALVGATPGSIFGIGTPSENPCPSASQDPTGNDVQTGCSCPCTPTTLSGSDTLRTILP